MYETQQRGSAPPPRPGPGPAAIVATLALTVVVGLVAAFVVVVGFWPAPSTTSYTAKEAAEPAAERSRSAAPSATSRIALDPAVPATTETAPLMGWPLIAADEFDGPALDLTRWQPYSGPANGGASQRLPEQVAVAGGLLTVTGRGVQSGGLAWQTDQTYGRWEVRARADAGAGYRPALLLWPQAEDWPRGGELDFLDAPKPDRSETNVVVHYGDDDERQVTAVGGDFTGWHNYAVEWLPDHVAGFIDGQQVFRTENPAQIPTRPMHLAVQQDVGPSDDGWTPALDASTPPEVRMQVDWVRIYGP